MGWWAGWVLAGCKEEKHAQAPFKKGKTSVSHPTRLLPEAGSASGYAVGLSAALKLRKNPLRCPHQGILVPPCDSAPLFLCCPHLLSISVSADSQFLFIHGSYSP